ncbi:MAG TPA: hypothetical protein DIW47_16025 [Bacteroidetes bacterium]|nr:hypothetical protein [Bacteroidota bacterium]
MTPGLKTLSAFFPFIEENLFPYFRGMKYSLIFLSVVILSSCSLFRKKCTTVSLKTENADMVQAMGSNSMYAFIFVSGELAGASLHLTSQESGEKDVFLVNPAKTYVTEPVEKEKWVLKEKKDDAKQWVEMSGSIALKVDGVSYCIDLSYVGSMMKHPSPPPLPHQE